MPRYFFDVHNQEFSTRDDAGRDCADRERVSEIALQVLCDIAREKPLKHMHSRLGAIVRDESGEVVLTATVNLSTTWVGDA
ncbi:DUF6894 family protein [Methylobacterium nigriterrae]|uniref:DUF6894 family protein n=1 Tax=Methylobacterium nigriterrae TaxID=3127512 RepID=UPI003013B875